MCQIAPILSTSRSGLLLLPIVALTPDMATEFSRSRRWGRTLAANLELARSIRWRAQQKRDLSLGTGILAAWVESCRTGAGTATSASRGDKGGCGSSGGAGGGQAATCAGYPRGTASCKWGWSLFGRSGKVTLAEGGRSRLVLLDGSETVVMIAAA